MNRLGFMLLLASPMLFAADDKKPTVEELQDELDKAVALLVQAMDRIGTLENENEQMKNALSVDRNCA